MTVAGAGLEPAESWDTLNFTEPQQLHWTTDNVGEAAPGVLTPLSYSMWHPVGDSMSRRMAYEMGVYSRRELTPPSEVERVVHLFYGRIAMKVEFVAELGDRMPGTTGEEVVKAMFGTVPETLATSPTMRRYPVIAVKMPIVFARARHRVNQLAPEADSWWREQIPLLPGLSMEQALATYDEGFKRFDHYMKVHSVGFLGSVRPMYDALEALVERAGVGDAGLLSGSGGAEMAIVESIWRAGRGEIKSTTSSASTVSTVRSRASSPRRSGGRTPSRSGA